VPLRALAKYQRELGGGRKEKRGRRTIRDGERQKNYCLKWQKREEIWERLRSLKEEEVLVSKKEGGSGNKITP